MVFWKTTPVSNLNLVIKNGILYKIYQCKDSLQEWKIMYEQKI